MKFFISLSLKQLVQIFISILKECLQLIPNDFEILIKKSLTIDCVDISEIIKYHPSLGKITNYLQDFYDKMMQNKELSNIKNEIKINELDYNSNINFNDLYNNSMNILTIN